MNQGTLLKETDTAFAVDVPYCLTDLRILIEVRVAITLEERSIRTAGYGVPATPSWGRLADLAQIPYKCVASLAPYAFENR